MVGIRKKNTLANVKIVHTGVSPSTGFEPTLFFETFVYDLSRGCCFSYLKVFLFCCTFLSMGCFIVLNSMPLFIQVSVNTAQKWDKLARFSLKWNVYNYTDCGLGILFPASAEIPWWLYGPLYATREGHRVHGHWIKMALRYCRLYIEPIWTEIIIIYILIFLRKNWW